MTTIDMFTTHDFEVFAEECCIKAVEYASDEEPDCMQSSFYTEASCLFHDKYCLVSSKEAKDFWHSEANKKRRQYYLDQLLNQSQLSGEDQ